MVRIIFISLIYLSVTVATAQVTHTINVNLNVATSCGILSNDDLELNDFSIFPNPVTQHIKVSNHKQVEIQKISIHNILGQEILSKKIKNQSDISLSVTALKAGIYFMRVHFDRGSYAYRFIKN